MSKNHFTLSPLQGPAEQTLVRHSTLHEPAAFRRPRPSTDLPFPLPSTLSPASYLAAFTSSHIFVYKAFFSPRSTMTSQRARTSGEGNIAGLARVSSERSG